MKILLLIIYLISGPVRCSNVIGYSGGTITLHCNLKWELNSNVYICKMRQSDYVKIMSSNTTCTCAKMGRFMLCRNKGSLTAMIQDLQPGDAGEYRIGVGSQKNCSVNLEVDTGTLSTTIQPTVVSSTAKLAAISSNAVCYGPCIIISLYACMTLLLIEGFVLILYKLICKKIQDSSPSSTGLKNNKKATSDYENDLPSVTLQTYQNIRMSPIQQNLHLYTNQSYSVYQSLNPKTQINSIYHTLQSSSTLHSPMHL